MACIPQTDSRIANATLSWQAICDTDVTGWDKANPFVLATWALSNAAHGNDSGTYKLQWRRQGGSFADVTGTSEIRWADSADTDLVDGNTVATTSGCQTSNNSEENEGDNQAGAFSVGYGTYAEIQWGLKFGSGALNNQEYEFQLVETQDTNQAVCSVSITTAATSKAYFAATINGAASITCNVTEPRIEDEYTPWDIDDSGDNLSAYEDIGQCFNAGLGGKINKIKIKIDRDGTPGGTCYLDIWNTTGTYGSTMVPTGSPIASSVAQNCDDMPLTPAVRSFYFTGVNRIKLTQNTKYAWSITYSGGTQDASNNISPRQLQTSPTHAGNTFRRIDSGSAWGARPTEDTLFRAISFNTVLPKATINGAATITCNITDASGGTSPISATINGAASITCHLTAGKSRAAIINGAASITCHLTAQKSRAAIINGAASVTAHLTARKQRSAIINGALTVTCDIGETAKMSATINGAASVTCHATARTKISATINGALSVTCDIHETAKMSATINGAASITCNIIDASSGVVEISATVNGAASITCHATARTQISATINGAVSVTCHLVAHKYTSATINGVATITCRLVAHKYISATINGAASLTCDMIAYAKSSATINGAATITCNIIDSAATEVYASATINGAATITCRLKATAQPTATINGAADLAAHLTARKQRVAIINGAASIVCHLSARKTSTATINGALTVTCSINARHRISATVQGASSITCHLTAGKRRSCIINAQSSITAHLVRKYQSSATVNGGATVTCQAKARRLVRGTINGVSTITANMVLRAYVSATINGGATVTCSLSIQGIEDLGDIAYFDSPIVTGKTFDSKIITEVTFDSPVK
jgi:hypothetical protein